MTAKPKVKRATRKELDPSGEISVWIIEWCDGTTWHRHSLQFSRRFADDSANRLRKESGYECRVSLYVNGDEVMSMLAAKDAEDAKIARLEKELARMTCERNAALNQGSEALGVLGDDLPTTIEEL